MQLYSSWFTAAGRSAAMRNLLNRPRGAALDRLTRVTREIRAEIESRAHQAEGNRTEAA